MDPLAELTAARAEMTRAVDIILDMTSAALVRAETLEDERARDRLRRKLCAILEACAFQDLTGQRLDKVSAFLRGEAPPADPLLEGPQAAGRGLDQDMADALFGA